MGRKCAFDMEKCLGSRPLAASQHRILRTSLRQLSGSRSCRLRITWIQVAIPSIAPGKKSQKGTDDGYKMAGDPHVSLVSLHRLPWHHSRAFFILLWLVLCLSSFIFASNCLWQAIHTHSLIDIESSSTHRPHRQTVHIEPAKHTP